MRPPPACPPTQPAALWTCGTRRDGIQALGWQIVVGKEAGDAWPSHSWPLDCPFLSFPSLSFFCCSRWNLHWGHGLHGPTAILSPPPPPSPGTEIINGGFKIFLWVQTEILATQLLKGVCVREAGGGGAGCAERKEAKAGASFRPIPVWVGGLLKGGWCHNI